MKDKKNLLYIITVVCTLIAACAVIYAFRDEIREFFEKLCAKANALKEKAACKLSESSDADDDFETDFADDDEDIEVEITFAKDDEAASILDEAAEAVE